MNTDDFIHGKVEQHLLNLDSNVLEMKDALKVHYQVDVKSFDRIHARLDDIAEIARVANGIAYALGKENKKLSDNIEGLTERIAKIDRNFIKASAFISAFSFIVGALLPWIKSKIFHI